MIVTVIWFPCCRILGLNIIWKTVDLHQRELLTRYMKTQQQLMSTWLHQICQMYCSWPGNKYSPFLYLSILFLIKTIIVMSFINQILFPILYLFSQVDITTTGVTSFTGPEGPFDVEVFDSASDYIKLMK